MFTHVACAGVAGLVGAQITQAQTWDGGGANNNWGTANNWNPNGVPTSSATTDIIFAGVTRLAPNVNTARTLRSLTFNSTAGAFTIGGSALTIHGGGITNNSSNLQTLSTAIALAAVQSWDSGASGLTMSGVVSGGSALTKTGSGQLTLSGANTFTGAFTASAGTTLLTHATALGSTAGGTTVDAGAQISVQGGIFIGAESLTLNGTGVSGGGSLRNVSGNNTWAAPVTLGSSSTVYSATAGSTLTLGVGIAGGAAGASEISLGANTLTLDGPGNITLSGVKLTGTGDVVMNGTGTVTYYGGANTHTGLTSVNNGTLVLDSYDGSNDGIVGDLVIGDGVGAADSALVRSGPAISPAANEVIANTSNVTINSDGKLDLNTETETIGSLTLNGGHVDTRAAGMLILNGSVTSTASSQTALIEGQLNLNATPRTFTVSNGSAASDLTVNAVVSSGGVVKEGDGTLTLTSASNTYAGGTVINAGTIAVGSNGALGATTGGVTLNGGTLEAVSSFTTARALTLSAGGGMIQTDAGATLTFGGSVSGAGDLTKTGDGTLAFTTSLTFSSDLTLSGGTLAILSNSTLTIADTLHITADSTIDFGSASASKLNVSTLLIDAGVTLNITGWINLSDQFIAQNFAGATLNSRGTGSAGQVIFSGFSGSNTIWQSYDKQITPVPEPSTYGVIMIGSLLSGCGWIKLRRSRKSARLSVG